MTSFKNILAASAVALLTATAQGHMVMATPPPYGSPDNSPLIADGSNFPCKATSNTGGTVTNMAIGASQKLSFTGQAVHGGGSCQISLTTDSPATKSSKWMVIHSIEGGCPAKNTAGNLGENAAAPDPDTYSFSIPQGINPGAYTLAWTWFNKVGNREMYMNCASIKVTGGSNKRGTYLNETEFAIPDLSGRDTSSFPAMFIANIPATDCTTAESKDLQFPNPGTSIEKDGVASDLAPPTGPKCGASGSSSSGTLSSNSSSGSSSDTQAASPSVGSSAGGAPSVALAAGGAAPSVAPAAGGAAPSVAPSAGGATPAVTATAGGAAPSVAAAVVASSPAAAGAAATSPAAAAAAGPASPPSTNSSGSSSCSSPGSLICSPDGTQFAICPSSGIAPIFQSVAAGTSCKGGAIAAAKSKRSAKFAREFHA